MRISIVKHMADGTVVDGTALCHLSTISDFRDLAEAPMTLEAGASFVIPVGEDRQQIMANTHETLTWDNPKVWIA